MEGPKTAHEEAVMMRKLYQEMVLKKQLDTKEADKPVQIQGLSRKKQETAEPAFGLGSSCQVTDEPRERVNVRGVRLCKYSNDVYLAKPGVAT